MDQHYWRLLEALNSAKPPSGDAEERATAARRLEQTRYRIERYLVRYRPRLPADRSRFLRQALSILQAYLVDHAEAEQRRQTRPRRHGLNRPSEQPLDEATTLRLLSLQQQMVAVESLLADGAPIVNPVAGAIRAMMKDIDELSRDFLEHPEHGPAISLLVGQASRLAVRLAETPARVRSWQPAM